MNLKIALPLLVLLPGACAQTTRPQSLPALAEQRQCPAYPLPPADLLKPPVKVDFFGPTN